MVASDFTMFYETFYEPAQLLQDEIANMLLSKNEGAWMLRFPLLSSYAYHPNRTWTVYAGLLERFMAHWRLGYDREAWKKIDDEMDSMLDEGASWRFGPNFIGKEVLRTVVPAWSSIATSTLCSEFQSVATEVVVAAELFRRKTGAYPAALADLVPDFMPSVPADPFKPGSALNYDAVRGTIWTVGASCDFDGVVDKKKEWRTRRDLEVRSYVVDLK